MRICGSFKLVSPRPFTYEKSNRRAWKILMNMVWPHLSTGNRSTYRSLSTLKWNSWPAGDCLRIRCGIGILGSGFVLKEDANCLSYRTIIGRNMADFKKHLFRFIYAMPLASFPFFF